MHPVVNAVYLHSKTQQHSDNSIGGVVQIPGNRVRFSFEMDTSGVPEVSSGIDLALIEQDATRKVAMDVARMFVVYLKRAGGQSQYSALLGA